MFLAFLISTTASVLPATLQGDERIKAKKQGYLNKDENKQTTLSLHLLLLPQQLESCLGLFIPDNPIPGP